jgi:hypothetical protein
MMQAIMISLLMLVNLLSLNCATREQAASTKIERMPVTAAEIIDTVAVGQEVWFKATASTPAPCWRFHHNETSRDQDEVSVEVYAEYDDRPCVQAASSVETAGTIAINEPGVYTFKFWQGEGETLDKKVVVE